MTDELMKEDKPQTIKLGDKEYELSPMNLNVMSYIEEEFDCNFTQFGKLLKDGKAKEVSSLRKLLFIFLRDNYPDLTINDMGKSITPDNLEETYNTMGLILWGEKYTELKKKVKKQTKEE